MEFKEFVYKRPDVKKTCDDLEALGKKIENSLDVEEIKRLIKEIENIKIEFESMMVICSIRNTIDTTDKFYEDEQEFFDNESPKYSSAITKISKVLVNHPKRYELEKIYTSHWFKMMEVSLKTFDDSIMDELVEESKLTTKYSKLLASCQIEYDGKINNLSQMGKYSTAVDRNVRLEASKLIDSFFACHEDELDEIYDKLVKVRTKMAKKLGYENYLEFGYLRMGRTDYNYLDVRKYRKQVLDYIVPVSEKLFANQAKRIKITNPEAFDMNLEFLDGNPTPKGNKDELVMKASKMYSEMSLETDEFFKYMVSGKLMDLETKKGKQGGGYCTYIPKYHAPFIFSNFNQTKGDVDVLTHEAGHAFEVYRASKHITNPDLMWPTMEACEIHSMSMEFFAYPWMNSFFGDDERKYKISHMSGAITFIPYGCLIDNFQEEVYLNYNMTPAERKECFRKLEKMYLPSKKYTYQPMWEKGCYWFRQQHVFNSPLYYIDYTLAQVCAIEFYEKNLDNHSIAWHDYLHLCDLGGSMSFLELLKETNLSNPFEDGTISKIINRLLPIIDSYSD